MRMRAGVVTAAVIVFAMGGAAAQECDTFQECMAGMCQGGGCVGVPLNSGPCNDFNPCTTNDTCVSGECQGTAAAGGACNDFNECTLNDECTDFGGGEVFCMGATPAATGTRCAGDCGTCQPAVPVPGAPLLCAVDVERLNGVCTPEVGEETSACFVGRCMALGVPGFQVPFCSPTLKTCPDVDGNLCTGEFCNFETDECETAPLPVRAECFPAECHRCVPETGACVPNNVGSSCDDFNVCTASTVCNAEGGCTAGSPQQTATPTATVPGANTPTNTVAVNTATPTSTPGTPTSTPTQGRCVGDCDNSGQVRVNELVSGVNIALDRAEFEVCPEFDINGNSGIEVNELVSGVNSLIRGCVAASAALSR